MLGQNPDRPNTVTNGVSFGVGLSVCPFNGRSGVFEETCLKMITFANMNSHIMLFLCRPAVEHWFVKVSLGDPLKRHAAGKSWISAEPSADWLIDQITFGRSCLFYSSDDSTFGILLSVKCRVHLELSVGARSASDVINQELGSSNIISDRTIWAFKGAFK